MDHKKRYTDYNTYLRNFFGERVQKVSVDAGLTCPNRDGKLSTKGCIYCNSKGSGSGLFEKGLSIRQQIEKGKIGAVKKYKSKKFLAYFQSYSNTYTSVEHMKEMFDEALSCEGVVGMAVGTRPDCVDEKKIALLAAYAKQHLVWVEYGLQSAHDKTLKIINRQHDLNDFIRAVEMTKGNNINICAHIIFGLPGEDRKMMLDNADFLADLGINGVKLHLLYVVKGTALDQMWQKGQYTPMTQEDYVRTVCDFIERLPKKIIIQRITGDPHVQELQAPMWAANYRETFNLIQKEMDRRGTVQGCRYNR